MSSAPINPDQMICHDSASAMIDFVVLGLPPGSFVTHLLKRDHEAATRAAHPVVREWDGMAGMFEIVERYIPAGMFDTDEQIERWAEIGGMRGCSEAERLQLYMFTTDWEKLLDRRMVSLGLKIEKRRT